jgi:hypothetical protein
MHRTSFAALIAVLLVPRLASPQGEPLGPEFRVNTATSFSQGYAAVAAIGEDFVVVWQSQKADGSGSGGSGVVGQRFDGAGNPLGTEFRVNSYTIGPQRHPAVGGNASGSFVVVWENGPYGCGPPCPPPTGVKVTGQRYAASGAPLGPEFIVDGASYEHNLRVTVAPSGAFLVVWSSVGGSAPPPPSDVFARLYDSAGVPQGAPFLVSARTQ